MMPESTSVRYLPFFLNPNFSFPIIMLQLTKTTLFHWDLASEFIHNRSHTTKKNISGPQSDLRKVQAWVSKMQSPALQPAGGSSASAHSFASRLMDTDLAASMGSQCSASLMGSSSDAVQCCISDVDAGDSKPQVTHCEHGLGPPLVRDSPHIE